MKQAYQREFLDYDWVWVPVELTGICKKVTGGPDEDERHYYQAQRRFIGLPLGKYWISKDYIKFFEPIVETEYECECGKHNG
jgi:hypothetical protein